MRYSCSVFSKQLNPGIAGVCIQSHHFNLLGNDLGAKKLILFCKSHIGKVPPINILALIAPEDIGAITSHMMITLSPLQT